MSWPDSTTSSIKVKKLLYECHPMFMYKKTVSSAKEKRNKERTCCDVVVDQGHDLRVGFSLNAKHLN